MNENQTGDTAMKAFHPTPTDTDDAPVAAIKSDLDQLWRIASSEDFGSGGIYDVWNKWGAASAAVMDIAVYACVSAISETIGGATWRVVDADGETTLGSSETTDSSDPLTRLLHEANGRGDGSSFFYEWAENLYITGENYVYLSTDKGGGIEELSTLNSLRCDPYAPNDVIEYYNYTGNGKYLPLPLDSVVFDRLRGNKFSEVRGYAPVMATLAAGVPQVIQAAGRTMHSYFVNDGMPGSVMAPDATSQTPKWEAKEMDYIRDQMRKNKGAGGKYRTLVFPYPYKAEVFQQPDVQKWALLLKELRPDVYRSYRVSPVIVGDATSPYQNSEENRINFHQMIASRLKAIALVIKTRLMPRIYGRNSGKSFEFELTPFEHIDPQERQAAKDLYTLGVITGNELREAYGWKKSDLAEVRYDPSTQTNMPLSAATPPALAGAAQIGAPVGNPESEKAEGGVCIMLDLGNDPDLIELQRRVQSLAGEAKATWNDPASFHVTLAYSPTGDPESMIEAVRALDLPHMELNIGSLAAFDSLGQNAAHLRIRSNANLFAYQAEIADALSAVGVPLSSHYSPDHYIPHITLGYIQGAAPKATFNTRLKVTPRAVLVKRGDEVLYSSSDAAQIDEIDAYAEATRKGTVMKSTFVWHAIDPDTGELINRHVIEADPTERRAIVSDWRKAILARLGVTDYAIKAADELPMPVILAMKTWRSMGVRELDVQKAARELYAAIVGRKSISQLQNRFETEALRVFRRGNEAVSTRQGFENALYNLVEKYQRQAMPEGYTTAGLAGHQLDESDLKYLADIASKTRENVAKVGAAIYADEMLSDAEIAGKPPMWFRLEVLPAFNEGLTRGAKDGLGRFEGEDGDDSCVDCQKMQGRVYRFSEWKKALGGRMPPSKAFACGGFNCNHRIVPYKGFRTVGGVPRTRGYRKSSDSEHLLEMDEIDEVAS